MIQRFMLICAILLPPTATAQEAPSRSYTSVVDEDGDIQIVPSAELGVSNASDTLHGSSIDSEGVFPDWLSADAIALIKSQDWYAGFGAEGELKAVYTLPRGESLSGEVFAEREVGWGIQKVEPVLFGLGNIFLDEEALIRQLDDFVTTAVRSFCGFDARPTEFESEVDISPGWGVAGKIKFKGKWVSSDVCNKLQ